MNLLEIIQKHGFNEDYYKQFGIRLKFNEPYVLFKYTLGDTEFNEDWEKECRGHIIDTRTMQFACRPFDKFFNYGEDKADSLEYDKPILVREKVDGTLIKVWYSDYYKKWIISSNSNIFAKDSEVPLRPEMNYEDLFIKAYKETYGELNTDDWDTNYTYMFELCTPLNIVVVPHKNYVVYFLAKRHKITGIEEYSDFHFDIVPYTWTITNLQDALEVIKQFDLEENAEEEGIVITDCNQKKIKIKTETYLKIAYALDNPRNRNNLKWLWNNWEEREELSSYNSDLKENFSKLNLLFEKMQDNLIAEQEHFKQYLFKNKKDLAQQINKFKNKDFIFKLYDGWTLEKYLNKNNKYSDFERMLNIYNIDKSIV